MGVLTAIVFLAAIGLIFALDPGETIAASGLPEIQEMGWRQLAAWSFRTAGVALAQLLVIVLSVWPRYRPPQASVSYPGAPKPGSMPAAAVSVLEGHSIQGPTMLAAIIEMCQRGTLRIEAVGTRAGFIYGLSRPSFTQHAWERTMCDSLPLQAATIDELHEALKKREDAIGDQIGEYLQNRGLFNDNPVRVRRENSGDGDLWWMLACLLTGVGVGFWTALWLEQWWLNALIGGSTGLVYSVLTVPSRIRTGMLKPTTAGVLEISQWLGWKESIAGSAPPDARSQSDPELAYAVAFDVARRRLDVAASAPPWFGTRGETSLPNADPDAAYRAFMHAPHWSLTGRSEDAAKAAARQGYEEEAQLLEQLDLVSRDADQSETAIKKAARETEAAAPEPEFGRDPPATTSAPMSAGNQASWAEPMVDRERSKRGGCLRGCLLRLVSLLGIGAAALIVLLSLDVVSPREKPCPLNSPPIPTPAQIIVLEDLFRDQCVRVSGTLVSNEADVLALEVDRVEYAQQVMVRVPAGPFTEIPLGKHLALGGRLRVGEDGTHEVQFVPDRGSDRHWWQNLRENLESLFSTALPEILRRPPLLFGR